MKLEEMIKSEGLIESGFEVTKGKYHKKKKSIVVSFEIDKALTLTKYQALSKRIREIFESIGVLSSIEIQYHEQLLADEEYREYLNLILKQLSEESARFKVLDSKDCRIEDHSIQFMVAYDALGVEELCKPIAEEFKKFGLSVTVQVVKDEKKVFRLSWMLFRRNRRKPWPSRSWRLLQLRDLMKN